MYGQNHRLTGWHSFDTIQFICCDEFGPTCSLACLTDDFDIYDQCNVDALNETTDCGFTFTCGAACGNTIRPKFESDTTYYFLSYNQTSCMNGLKLSFTFDPDSVDTDECNTPIEPGCDALPSGLRTDNTGYSANSYPWSIVAKDDCKTDYVLTGPQKDGWFAYAWYGTYTNGGMDLITYTY